MTPEINRTHVTGRHVLLTGATGFVGKVVLEELLRQRELLGIEAVHLLIRPGRKGQSPEQRFEDEVAASPCFSKLEPGWTQWIHVVPGDLTAPQCGVDPGTLAALGNEITHIIHCAASVEFDLPLAQAARSNITSALSVLKFARSCARLEMMVSTSTAYATPYPGVDVPVSEEIHPLPRPARTIFDAIVDGSADAQALLAETGHPNTYTLTKCLAEHLLLEERGDVPLAIVRPSIVSACWQHPMPGWIDSYAAYAGFVALIGTGFLHTVVCEPETRLDLVPCDQVAKRLITCAFMLHPSEVAQHPIRHAVSGAASSPAVQVCCDRTTDYFTPRSGPRRAGLHYVGLPSPRFHRIEWQHQILPVALARAWYAVTGRRRQARRAGHLAGRLKSINRSFSYFTHHTFHFETSLPLDLPAFDPAAYVDVIYRGVDRHLLGGDDTQRTFAGRAHRDGQGDLRWALRQPHGNRSIRFGGWLVRKALRRMSEAVTFDRPSFEAARASVPEDSLLVVVPCHRSYLDFLLCSYLFFDQPGLGIAIPHIAAAREFSRIPVLGRMFARMQAFFLDRGQGREDARLTGKVRELVDGGQTLQFFIEGTRSRSRQWLHPKRGLLRCLQGTGQRCHLLPVAISYDRVPEEPAFRTELRGGPKPPMRLGGLLRWCLGLLVGRVRLGRIHLSCGEPIELGAHTDVPSAARAVVGELQAQTVATTHHLASFVAGSGGGVFDEKWLRQAIEARGGRVLHSDRSIDDVDGVLEACLRYHWQHLFYGDALVSLPGHPAVQNHVARNQFAPVVDAPKRVAVDERTAALIQALFSPVCRDYVATAAALGEPGSDLDSVSARTLVAADLSLHLPHVEAALESMTERGILVESEDGSLGWGPTASLIAEYEAACRWPDAPPDAADISSTERARRSHGQPVSPGDRRQWVSRPPSA